MFSSTHQVPTSITLVTLIGLQNRDQAQGPAAEETGDPSHELVVGRFRVKAVTLRWFGFEFGTLIAVVSLLQIT